VIALTDAASAAIDPPRMPRTTFLLALTTAAVAVTAAPAEAAVDVFNAKPLTAQAGEAFAHRVVSFDARGACDRAAFAVSVEWGDGQTGHGEVVRAETISPGVCTYEVDGEHTYAEGGSYAVRATICRGADCRTTPAPGRATVTAAPVPAPAAPPAPAPVSAPAAAFDPVLVVVGRTTRAVLRHRGLRLRTAGSDGRTLTVLLRDGRTGRTLHTGRATVERGSLRLHLPRTTLRRLGGGRRYGITIPAQAGVPTRQVGFLLR
jgi:hypothetical protein